MRDGTYIQVNGRRMYYREQGEGPVILYVHGNTGSSLWFSRVMDIPGCRTIAPDMVNFGRSDRIENSEISSYTEYLRGFMDALGIESCTLVGHSLGGAVAMGLAFSAPERVDRLLLVDSCPLSGLVTPEQAYPVIEQYRTDRELLRNALAAVTPAMNDQEFLDRLTDEARLMNPDSFLLHPRSLERVNFTGQAESFGKPALFIVGEKDPLISPQMARETMRSLNGPVVTLEQTGHSVIVEDPERFISILREFMKEHG